MRPIRLLACAAVTLIGFGFAADAAQAYERKTTTTGPNGQSASRTATRSGTGNATITRTGPNGQTLTRNRTTNPETGTTTGTVTGPNGQSATRTTTVTR